MIKSVVGASWGEVGPACGYSMLAPLRPAWSHLRGYVGPFSSYMLAHLGAMLAYLGAMWGQLAAQVGPSGGYVGPACARFRAYVGSKKMAKPQNTVNRGMFVGSAPSGAASTAGAGAPLSYRIDQVRQFSAEKVIPYLRQKKLTISLFFLT